MTVWPDDIDFARPVNFSGGQDAGTNTPSGSMESNPGDYNRFAPARTAISGDEGQDVPIATRESLDRHNHGPPGLHKGLSPNGMIMAGCRLCCSPRLSAVGGGAHLDRIVFTGVVKLGIAVAVEWAAGRIIADGPVFVVKLPICIHHDGIVPGQPPVGRTAGEHIDFLRVPIGGEAQERGQPDSVPGVKSHGSVTDTGIDARWCCEGSGARQEATGKAVTTIGGGGETYVGGATTEEAAHLEGGNNSGAKGKGIRFDFRPVLARAVGKRVATELEQGHLGKGQDG